MQILKHFNDFYYLFLMNIILYWINLYGFSFLITDKILIITYSLITTNLINLIVSHFQIKKNVFYLKNISLFFYEDIIQLKIESFFTFVKYSSVKGILFSFNYPGIYLIIFSSQLISTKISIILNKDISLSSNSSSNLIDNFAMASILSFILIALPHSFILSVSKYYKNYLENSVYDHSQNTKTRYLKLFWFIVISFTLIFSLIILLMKKTFFRCLLNLSLDFNKNLDTNLITNSPNEILFTEISQIFDMFDFILKFYCIFILFDSFGIAFQEIVKTFNDHSRNYLNFYKGISLVFVFFPIGIICAICLQWDFIWGFWIGFYSHMIVYSIILMIVNYRNYYNSTFQIFY
jgi:hypothetical protein